MSRTLLKILVPALLVGLSVSYPEEDLITDLPGLSFPINFVQYSGYLNGTEGRHLHYWFTESSRPEETPLILWLNGGPGCSSLDGLLTENGPFRVQADGVSLEENPYAWNNVGNVLYLESPACVGFSYDDTGNCVTTDDEVAEMNYLALQHFYAKFPEYRDREFFITGESYGGIYIPTLSVKIVEGNDTFPINFAGFAIGNGLTSYIANDQSMMFFGRYHSLLGQELWDEMVTRCCGGVEDRSTCDFFLNVTVECEASTLKAIQILEYSDIDVYNIYATCEGLSSSSASHFVGREMFDKYNLHYIRNRRYKRDLQLDPPCTDSSKERSYLNREVARDALHIPADVQDWELCSSEVSNGYKRRVFNSASYLKTLHDNGVRGLLYNGDVDMACNFLGNQWDIEDLQYEDLGPSSQWHVNGQVAGFVKKFELLDFVTIRGSGHMVPADKPAEALHLIDSFVNNVDY